MVGSVIYSDLEPLLLTANLHKNSSTGKAILQGGKFLVSYLHDGHREALEKFVVDRDRSGFYLNSFHEIHRNDDKLPPTPYVKDALLAFTAHLVGQFEHESSISIFFSAEETLETIFPSSNGPLIRYNRSYAKLAAEQIPSKDDYPV